MVRQPETREEPKVADDKVYKPGDPEYEETEEVRHGIDNHPTGDAEKGATLGGIGGAVTGAIAGSAAGPGGAVIGAVIGGVAGAAASGLAVAAVDRVDNDNTITGIGEGATEPTPTHTERADIQGPSSATTGAYVNDNTQDVVTPDPYGNTEDRIDAQNYGYVAGTAGEPTVRSAGTAGLGGAAIPVSGDENPPQPGPEARDNRIASPPSDAGLQSGGTLGGTSEFRGSYGETNREAAERDALHTPHDIASSEPMYSADKDEFDELDVPPDTQTADDMISRREDEV
jgi:hypothetical protein